MNAAETIQAAIDKLEELTTYRGVDNDWLWEIDPHVDPLRDDPRFPLVQGGPDVLLHRTIGPQLAILRHAQTAIEAVGDGPRAPLGIPEAVSLARAVLGEDPDA